MKNARRRKLLSALVGVFCLFLSGCSSSSASEAFFSMDTLVSITATGSRAKEATAAARAEVERWEKSLSAVDPESEIARLNAAGSLSLSADTASLIDRAFAFGTETGGAFNIAIRPVLIAWGFTTGDYRVPDGKEVTELLKLTELSGVSVKGNLVTLGEGQQIDLGGIGKGYASDRAAAVLRSYGVSSAILTLGGSVQLIGSKPEGSPWRIAVQDPKDGSEYLGILSAADTCLVTSGGYQRCFEEDGILYHHILDPDTGYPAQSGLASVTVCCGDCAKADAYSTAFYVMGLEDTVRFWRESPGDFELVLLTEDGRLFITSGLRTQFVSDRPYEVIEP